MQILIPLAQAADAPSGGFAVWDLLFIGILVAALYFLLLRPQQRRAREHRNLISSLSRGDEVVSGGGVIGRIVEVQDDFVLVEIAEKMRIRVQRGAITAALPKGTIRSIDESARGAEKGRNKKKRRGQDKVGDEQDQAEECQEEKKEDD